MAILITVEDFKGEVLHTLNDQQGLIYPILDCCFRNTSVIKVFKYVDIHDDTTFNSFLVHDLKLDIEYLKQHPEFKENSFSEFLLMLEKICEVALQEPHLYLKFNGD